MVAIEEKIMDDKTLEMEGIHSLLKEVKQSVVNYKSLRCVSIEVTISSEKKNYIRVNSVNPENGKEYAFSDIIERLDKNRLIEIINCVHRNTIKYKQKLAYLSYPDAELVISANDQKNKDKLK
jgi:hypothetical protein